MCWMQDPNEIPIIGEGKNTFPTLHVKDLVTLVRRIIEQKPNKYYIIATDKTRNKSLHNIISSLSKNIGNGLVRFTDNYEEVPNFHEFMLNMKIKSSKIFDDVKKDNETVDAFNKRKFPWHCEVKYIVI
jgi:nucleoside-diphosphate-sugar epimerase